MRLLQPNVNIFRIAPNKNGMFLFDIFMLFRASVKWVKQMKELIKIWISYKAFHQTTGLICICNKAFQKYHCKISKVQKIIYLSAGCAGRSAPLGRPSRKPGRWRPRPTRSWSTKSWWDYIYLSEKHDAVHILINSNHYLIFIADG